jgi:hypothetical protein
MAAFEHLHETSLFDNIGDLPLLDGNQKLTIRVRVETLWLG